MAQLFCSTTVRNSSNSLSRYKFIMHYLFLYINVTDAPETILLSVLPIPQITSWPCNAYEGQIACITQQLLHDAPHLNNEFTERCFPKFRLPYTPSRNWGISRYLFSLPNPATFLFVLRHHKECNGVSENAIGFEKISRISFT